MEEGARGIRDPEKIGISGGVAAVGSAPRLGEEDGGARFRADRWAPQVSVGERERGGSGLSGRSGCGSEVVGNVAMGRPGAVGQWDSGIFFCFVLTIARKTKTK